MKDTEPSLSSIEDYDTLKGSKKRIVWSVIISGLILGALFVGAKIYYGEVDDTIHVQDAIGKMPVK